MPKRTQGLLLGSLSLVLGPTIAVALSAATSPTRSVAGAGAGASGSLVERTGHSVLSVGHVVAVRAEDPAAITVAPFPLSIPPVAVPAPPVATPPAAPVVVLPLVVTPSPTPKPKVVAIPTPKPAASPEPPTMAPSGSVSDIIMAAAASHGVNGAWMVRIARCESGLNPRAVNPAGPWIGLFQFAPATFRGHGGTDIYSPTQQANIAASMLAAGQAHQWPVCSLK